MTDVSFGAIEAGRGGGVGRGEERI